MIKKRRELLVLMSAIGLPLATGCMSEAREKVQIIGLAVDNWADEPVKVHVTMEFEERDTITRTKKVAGNIQEDPEEGRDPLTIEYLDEIPLEDITVIVSFNDGPENEIPFEVEKADDSKCAVLQISYHQENKFTHDVEPWECNPYDTDTS